MKTPAACLCAIRCGAATPERIRDYLEAGAAGEFAETIKTGDPLLERVTNLIIGDNARALDGAARGRGAGLPGGPLARALRRGRRPRPRAGAHLSALRGARRCVLAGGEPVVTVRGAGRGGRAQELALSLAIELERVAPQGRIAALCAATDGTDGPTDAAGAFAPRTTAARARAANLRLRAWRATTPIRSLPCGDLLITGPTGTNVSDIFIGLVNY